MKNMKKISWWTRYKFGYKVGKIFNEIIRDFVDADFPKSVQGKDIKDITDEEWEALLNKKIPKEIKQAFNRKKEEIIGKSDRTNLIEDEQTEEGQERNREKIDYYLKKIEEL